MKELSTVTTGGIRRIKWPKQHVRVVLGSWVLVYVGPLLFFNLHYCISPTLPLLQDRLRNDPTVSLTSGCVLSAPLHRSTHTLHTSHITLRFRYITSNPYEWRRALASIPWLLLKPQTPHPFDHYFRLVHPAPCLAQVVKHQLYYHWKYLNMEALKST